jgi:hypothetical protein
MLITPHQVALHIDHLQDLAAGANGTNARWTWIAGRRFRGVRWL